MSLYDQTLNELFDSHIQSFFGKDGNSNSVLKEIITYSLEYGKRIRPKITMDIYHSLTNSKKITTVSVLAVEYIHTASLLIDDLPCMDNAIKRRNRDCAHIKYGEATTQLASIALISLGMNAMVNLPPFLLDTFSHMISDACEGQLLDLDDTNNNIKQMIQMKTGKFFEMSFILGWVLGGGDIEKIDEIKTISNDFSMAFQILDDIEDITDIADKNGNYTRRYGLEKAKADVIHYFNAYKTGLMKYNLYSDFFKKFEESIKF